MFVWTPFTNMPVEQIETANNNSRIRYRNVQFDIFRSSDLSMVRDHSFTTLAKFPEKVTFLTP